MQKIDMRNCVAFVTGASEGMGKATSFYLSKLHVNVSLAARRYKLIKKYANDIRQKFGTDPLAVEIDVTKDYQVKNAVKDAIKKYGKIDYVVNYAGNPIGYMRGDRKKPIYEQTIEHLKEIAEVDHFGSARILKYTLPHMIKAGYGMILLVSAITAVYGYSEDIDYIPYKKANEALALSTALWLDRNDLGVQIYTIAPGDVYNPSTWNSYSEEERAEAVEYGIIESETVAKIVSWLFSGRLKEKFEMKVDLDASKILYSGKFTPIKNGDVIVIDSKTVPKLFKKVGENYKSFIPEGY